MLERDVQEGGTRFREDLGAVAKLPVDVDAPPVARRHPGGDRELAVDQNGTAVADEDARRDGREAVPGGEEAARFVERRADETPVDDARGGLMALGERDGCVVAFDPLLARPRQTDPVRVLAAPPARRIVMRRNPLASLAGALRGTRAILRGIQRSPPRSKCAR